MNKIEDNTIKLHELNKGKKKFNMDLDNNDDDDTYSISDSEKQNESQHTIQQNKNKREINNSESRSSSNRSSSSSNSSNQKNNRDHQKNKKLQIKNKLKNILKQSKKVQNNKNESKLQKLKLKNKTSKNNKQESTPIKNGSSHKTLTLKKKKSDSKKDLLDTTNSDNSDSDASEKSVSSFIIKKKNNKEQQQQQQQQQQPISKSNSYENQYQIDNSDTNLKSNSNSLTNKKKKKPKDYFQSSEEDQKSEQNNKGDNENSFNTLNNRNLPLKLKKKKLNNSNSNNNVQVIQNNIQSEIKNSENNIHSTNTTTNKKSSKVLNKFKQKLDNNKYNQINIDNNIQIKEDKPIKIQQEIKIKQEPNMQQDNFDQFNKSNKKEKAHNNFQHIYKIKQEVLDMEKEKKQIQEQTLKEIDFFVEKIQQKQYNKQKVDILTKFEEKYDYDSIVEWNLADHSKVKKQWNKIYNLVNASNPQQKYFLTFKVRQHKNIVNKKINQQFLEKQQQQQQPQINNGNNNEIQQNQQQQQTIQNSSSDMENDNPKNNQIIRKFTRFIINNYGQKMLDFLNQNRFDFLNLCLCQDHNNDQECWNLQLEHFIISQFNHIHLVKQFKFLSQIQFLLPNQDVVKEGDIVKINSKGENMYEVEAIRGRRIHNRRGLQYYVQWRGYLAQQSNTWQCVGDLEEFQEKIQEFEQILEKKYKKNVNAKKEIILPNYTEKQLDQQQKDMILQQQQQIIELNSKINHCAIVMETAESDLHQLIQSYDNPLQMKFLHEIFAQILLGLQEIHSKGMAHNDIKSDNILVFHKNNTKGLIKIGDFGFMNFNKPFNKNIKYKESYQKRNLNFQSPEIVAVSKLDNLTLKILQNNNNQINQEVLQQQQQIINDNPYSKILNNPIDEQKCDIFALGLLFYECVFLRSALKIDASFDDEYYQHLYKIPIENYQDLKDKFLELSHENFKQAHFNLAPFKNFWSLLKRDAKEFSFNVKSFTIVTPNTFQGLVTLMLSPYQEIRPTVEEILGSPLFNIQQ